MRRAIVTACFTVAAIFGAFLMEPIFPLGDFRWGVAAVTVMLPALFLYRREISTHLSRIRNKSPKKIEIAAAVAFEPATANVHINKRKQDDKDLRPLVLAVLTLALIGGAIYYVVFVREPTGTVWTHQALSIAEQERAKAECEMKAIEVGGSGFKIGSPRFEYETACLKSKGFTPEPLAKQLRRAAFLPE